MMILGIMDYHQLAVLMASVTQLLEDKRGLYGRIAHHAGTTVEMGAVHAHALNEIVGMVEAGDGKVRQGVHHVGMEVPAILLLQTLRGR